MYRARDPRLQRNVALKIVHPSLTITPEQVDRFSREARAAGSLHHPNILVVFDVGVENGKPYLVSELLEGESLRDRLDRGPLPYRKALDYGIQMAQALGAAHAKGIWHRDVKPANTFITTDGRIKLLDFGLAKLSERVSDSASDETTADASKPGMIRGTAGYMSPEQARAERVDHRTDLFSLGAILYEMFTGTRAFQRASTVETLHAVLREEPADPLELTPSLPLAAAVTVRRCLEKSVEERFQSARDLAFQLQQLRDGTLAGRLTAAAAAASWRRRALLAGMLALAALGVAWAIGHFPRRSPSFEQLSFRRGRIGGARFVSEGQAVIYSEAGDRNQREVWRLDPSEGPKSRALTRYAGAELMATRKGELALSLDRRFVGGKHFVGRLATAPIDGDGRPREVRNDVEDADWDPAGKDLATVITTGPGGAESRLEYPPGHVLHVARSIRSPRFSPDGQRIAFLEDTTGPGIVGRVAVVDLEGHFTPLTEVWRNARGLAWSPAGDEVWFTAGGWWADRALRAVDLGKGQRLVLSAPTSLTLWDIARDGRVLFTRDEENRGLMGRAPGDTEESDLSLYDSSGLASLSADGHSLLFNDRFGLYLRGADETAPPLDLGFAEAYADDLSPDGKWAVATTSTPSRLVLVPTGAGDRRELPPHGIVSYNGALWFPRGRRILFNGAMAGEPLRSYVQDIERGAPVPLTPFHTRAVAISPDERWVAGIGAEPSLEMAAASAPAASPPGITLWPVAGGPSRSVPGSQADDRPVAWSEDGKSLWVFRWTEVPAEVYRLDIDSGRRELAHTLMPRDTAGVEAILTFRTTPKGEAYFYTYRRVLSKLYLARDLR